MSGPVSTPIFEPTPSLMLVGLDDQKATLCADAVSPVPVLRVVHAQAAIERMLVTWPLVIVLREGIGPKDAVPLRDAARDIGAEVVQLDGFLGAAGVISILKLALARAEESRRSRGSPPGPST